MKKFRVVLAMLALALVVGLAFVGCGEQEDKIFGLTYSDSVEGTDWQGNPVTGYLVEHTYEEALRILTREIGAPNGGWAFLIGDMSSLQTRPNWVIFQVLSRQYRLVSQGSTQESGNTSWNW